MADKRWGADNLHIEEVLLYLLARHGGRVMVVQSAVHAGHVLGVVYHRGYVVAHYDDGAVSVDVAERLVHLLLESLVDVSVRLIQN